MVGSAKTFGRAAVRTLRAAGHCHWRSGEVTQLGSFGFLRRRYGRSAGCVVHRSLLGLRRGRRSYGTTLTNGLAVGRDVVRPFACVGVVARHPCSCTSTGAVCHRGLTSDLIARVGGQGGGVLFVRHARLLSVSWFNERQAARSQRRRAERSRLRAVVRDQSRCRAAQRRSDAIGGGGMTWRGTMTAPSTAARAAGGMSAQAMRRSRSPAWGQHGAVGAARGRSSACGHSRANRHIDLVL